MLYTNQEFFSMNQSEQFPEPTDNLQEISRQIMTLVDGSGADHLRLEISEWHGGRWRRTGLLAMPINGESRLEIVLLKEAGSFLEAFETAAVLPEPIGVKYVSAPAGVNVRSGPTTGHEILTRVPQGERVELLKEGEWDLIRTGNITGYVFSELLSKKDPFEPAKPDEAFKFQFWPTLYKEVTQHFGENPDLYKEVSNGFLPAHEGIDLKAPMNTPYFAVAPGTVSSVSDKNWAGEASPYGWHVVVNHGGGYSTLYAHARADIPVKAGDQVTPGQVLAYSGNTGYSSGPHLHLTLKKSGTTLPGWPPDYIDPWPFLEPLYNEVAAPAGNLREGFLFAQGMDKRGSDMAIAKLNLNMREEPDSDSRLLAVVPQGSAVRILNEALQNGYYFSEAAVIDEAQPKKVLDLPQPESFDVLEYIKGDGRQYEVRNAFESQERFQVREDGLTFYLVKNTHWEKFFYDNDFVYRDIDTSPGSGRYYRLTDPDRQFGSRWLRRKMAPGQTYTQPRRVQFYNAADGSPSAANSGNVIDTIKLVAHHDRYKFQTGIEMEDVLEFHWVVNETDHTPREKYFYARGLGMAGWARGHQDPNTPAWSAVSEIHEKGTRDPFKREKIVII
jgi:murein DD-endopeptidase MepM/ murein hydrolase activator NlpD